MFFLFLFFARPKKRNQKKGRPAPRFSLRVADPAGALPNSTFSLLAQRKLGALRAQRTRMMNGFLILSSFFNRRRSRR